MSTNQVPEEQHNLQQGESAPLAPSLAAPLGVTAPGTFSKLAALIALLVGSMLAPWPAGPMSGLALLAALVLWALGMFLPNSLRRSVGVVISLAFILAGWGYRLPEVPWAKTHHGFFLVSVGCAVLSLCVALLVHAKRWIVVTKRLRREGFGALLLIALGGPLLLPKSFYTVPSLYAGPPLELVFAALVWAVATLQMVCLFESMTRDIVQGAPRRREWETAMMLLLYMIMVVI